MIKNLAKRLSLYKSDISKLKGRKRTRAISVYNSIKSTLKLNKRMLREDTVKIRKRKFVTHYADYNLFDDGKCQQYYFAKKYQECVSGEWADVNCDSCWDIKAASQPA